jgi:hypothetical protein
VPKEKAGEAGGRAWASVLSGLFELNQLQLTLIVSSQKNESSLARWRRSLLDEAM